MTNGTMTELELTKMENFALKHRGLQQELQANLIARTQYIKQIEAAHPGYLFSEVNGQLVKPTEPENPDGIQGGEGVR
jgi:hypothetical protein